MVYDTVQARLRGVGARLSRSDWRASWLIVTKTKVPSATGRTQSSLPTCALPGCPRKSSAFPPPKALWLNPLLKSSRRRDRNRLVAPFATSLPRSRFLADARDIDEFKEAKIMCNGKNHSPGCTCGWGGEGHSGKSQGRVFDHTPSNVKHFYGNFYNRTKCYYCNKEIYFVRHNNGSIWFDELGKPWPKHECYYKYYTNFSKEHNVQTAINYWLKNLDSARIGIVVDVQEREFDLKTLKILNRNKILTIRDSDGGEVALRVFVDFSVEGFLGEFVIFSFKNGYLIRPYINTETKIEIGYKNSNRSIMVKRIYNEGYIFCSICNVYVKRNNLSKHVIRVHNRL